MKKYIISLFGSKCPIISSTRLTDLCDDVWPDKNCLKLNCAYSEVHPNVQAPNNDLFKCSIWNIVLCKACKFDACHDFHGKHFVEMREDT